MSEPLVEDLTVPAEHPVPVRRYRPAGDADAARTTVVWMHGGAFLSGSLDMTEADLPCRAFARAGFTAVSVGYRLVPGPGARRRADAVRFPSPLEDCVAAWNWAVDQASPGGTVFVGGASAGGALATTLTLRVRPGRTPHGVVLGYPLLHAELPPLPAEVRHSVRGLRRLGTFTRRSVRWMGRNYVGPAGLARLPEAFPAPEQLAGFPPTLIVDSERDTLRASSHAFADALRAHGVPVTHAVEPGTRHGHLNRDDEAAGRSVQRMVAWIGEQGRR